MFRGFNFYKQYKHNNTFYGVVDYFIVLMNALIIVMILLSKYKYKKVTLISQLQVGSRGLCVYKRRAGKSWLS